MHPAMAIWIWMVAMGRAWQGSSLEAFAVGPDAEPEQQKPPRLTSKEHRLVLANGYLQSEIATSPLPESLLDRLAELYWAERDSELAI
jgi:hypothetical protein